jgi:AcrR family transcriptional regulator
MPSVSGTFLQKYATATKFKDPIKKNVPAFEPAGILVSFLVDYALSSSADWRLMFGLATIPAALLFVGRLTQAESRLAANELLAERGLVDLTIDEVAHRAGVGKTTIYRRWPSKGTLVFEAFAIDFLNRQPLPDTGSLRGDLLAALRAFIKVVKGTVTGPTVGLIAEVQRDPELAEIWREGFVGRVRTQHRMIVDRAVERGEASADTDPDVVLDLVFGSAYHRLLQSHLVLSDRFAQAVVGTVVAGVQPNRVGPTT